MFCGHLSLIPGITPAVAEYTEFFGLVIGPATIEPKTSAIVSKLYPEINKRINLLLLLINWGPPTQEDQFFTGLSITVILDILR